jgi:hypothetical protein
MDYEKTVPERYRATYDSKGDRWLILDMWHPQVKNMADLSQDIPESSPALKIIAGTEMNAVVGAMIKMGWIDRINNHKIIKDKPGNNIIKHKSNDYYRKPHYNRNRKPDIDYIVEEVVKRLGERKTNKHNIFKYR